MRMVAMIGAQLDSVLQSELQPSNHYIEMLLDPNVRRSKLKALSSSSGKAEGMRSFDHQNIRGSIAKLAMNVFVVWSLSTKTSPPIAWWR